MQQRILKYGIENFSKQLGTDVKIDSVAFVPYGRIAFYNIHINNPSNEEFLKIKSFKFSVLSINFWKKRALPNSLDVEGIKLILSRPSSSDKWNYSFLKKKKNNSKNKNNWEIIKGKFNIKDFTLVYADSLKGNMVDIQIPNFQFKLKKWSSLDKKILINSIRFENPNVYVGILRNDTILHQVQDILGINDKADRKLKLPFNPNNWEITIKQSKLIDGNFLLRYPNRSYKEHLFDYQNLAIKDIHTVLKNVYIEGDTLRSQVQSLKAMERSGLGIKSLEMNVMVSPQLINCEDIKLNTLHSRIFGDYSMEYEQFPAFLNYNEEVTMRGNIHPGSYVSWKDLNVFSHSLDRLNHNKHRISGSFEGPTNHLRGRNAKAFDNASTVISDFEIVGLPDIEHAVYTFNNFELKSNGTGISYYDVGNDLNQLTKNISSLKSRGNLQFSFDSLKFKGILESNLGDVNANIHLQYPFYLDKSIIENSEISFDQLLLNPWIPEDNTLTVSGKATIKNYSINQQVVYKLNTAIHELHLNNQLIQPIFVQAEGNSKSFTSFVDIYDSNINLHSQIDFNKNAENTNWKINNNIERLALAPWHAIFEDNTIILQGKNTIDFTKKPEGSYGELQILQAKDIKKQDYYKDLNIVYEEKQGLQTITLSAEDLQGYIKGRWRTTDWAYFKEFFKEKFFEKQESINPLQNPIYLNTQIVYQANGGLINAIFPNLKLQGQQKVFIEIDTEKDILEWNMHSDKIDWQNISFNHLHSKGSFNKSHLNALTEVDHIILNSQEWVNDLYFTMNKAEDGILFKINSGTSNNISNINAQALLFGDLHDMKWKILASSLDLKTETWNFPNSSENFHIHLKEKNLFINPISFTSNNQSLHIASIKKAPKNAHKFQIEKFNLGTINAFLPELNYPIDGLLSGTLEYSNTTNKNGLLDFNVTSSDIKIKEQSVGKLNSEGFIDLENKKIFWKKSSLANTGTLNWHGDFYWDENKNNSLHIQLKKFPGTLLNQFTEGQLRDISGILNGSLFLGGSKFKPIWKGSLSAKDLEFTPVFTGVAYSIPSLDFIIQDNVWASSNFAISDKNNNKAQADLELKNKNWKDWDINFNLATDSLQVLDLGIKENPYFYGDVQSKLYIQARGALENLFIDINATPLKNSKFYVIVKGDAAINNYTFINFKEETKNKDKTITTPTSKINKNDIHFNLQASINSDVELNLILDEALKDKIVARGNGFIQLAYNTGDALKMHGTYTIESGNYDFVFRQLDVLNFRKNFILYPNSIIKWDGNPWNALLDIKAYTIVKARLYDLISTEAERMSLSNQEIRDAQIAQPVLVQLAMDGPLSDPLFNFQISLEEGRSLGSLAYQRLQRINQDTKELINQIGSLLLLEQFIPSEGLSNANIASGSINNMSEIVSSVASSQITHLANKALGIEDLDIGIKYKNYNFTQNQNLEEVHYLNRNEAGVQLRKNFLSNRLYVEVEGSYDWGKLQAESSSNDFMGDFRIQYYVTEDGKVRLGVFRNSQYDVLYGKTVARQGLSIAYKKSFNSLKRREKDEKEDGETEDIKLREDKETKKNKEK